MSTANGMSGSRTYGYDNVDRLVSRTSSGLLHSAFPNASWNLDSVGNRTSTVVNGTTTAYTQNTAQLNQYATVGTASLTYDTKGNLLSDGTRSMTYDTDNRLTQVVAGGNTMTYTYDFAHRLAKRVQTGGSASAVRYIYDQHWNVIADIDASTGATLRKYVRGPRVDETLAHIDSNTYYYLHDHLGSTIALVHSYYGMGAGFTQRYVYDEYGAVQVRDGAGYPVSAAPITRYLFTGREWDAAASLYHFRHRWYAPGYGIFITPDPLGIDAGPPNFYGFNWSSPLNFVDPEGLSSAHVQAAELLAQCSSEAQIIEATSALEGLVGEAEASALIAARRAALQLSQRCIKNVDKIAQRTGKTVKQVRDALHAAKKKLQRFKGKGNKGNTDVKYDPKTGEVHPQLPNGEVSPDSLGPLFE